MKRRGQRPAFAGDPDITEIMDALRHAPHDGATYHWDAGGGVAYFGGMTGDLGTTAAAYRDPDPDLTAPVRQAGYRAWRQHHAGPPALEAPPPRPDRVRRPADAAMFTRTKDGPGLECGLCRWRRHTDWAVQSAVHIFDALRASAAAAGWRPDEVGRWVCPPCQEGPLWWPRNTARHSSSEWRAIWQEVPPESGHWVCIRPVPGMQHATAPEFGFEIIAEQAACERARHARSRVIIIRPDGRRVAARITGYRPRHLAGGAA